VLQAPHRAGRGAARGAARCRDGALGVGTQAASDSAHSAVLLSQAKLQDRAQRRCRTAVRRCSSAARTSRWPARQLADTKVLAPFEGAVVARLAGTGDYLPAGAPIARLVRYDPLRLRLTCPSTPRERSAAARCCARNSRTARGSKARSRPSAPSSPRRTARCGSRASCPTGRARSGRVRSRASKWCSTPPRARWWCARGAAALRGPRQALRSRRGQGTRAPRALSGRSDGSGSRSSRHRGGSELVLQPGNLQGGAAVRVIH